jgi:hypothetical protein
MARYLYGAGGDGEVVRPTGLPYANAAAGVYNSRTGGSPITDLQTLAGAAISSVTSDAYGQVAFFGPDNYIGTLWLDFGGGIRWALPPKAVDLAATRAIVVQRTADAAAPSFTTKAALPYNTADPLEQALAAKLDPLIIARFASQAARDAGFPSPVNGDRCYRTDLKADQIHDGTAWQTIGYSAWTQSTAITWTAPTTNPSLGTGTANVRFAISGKTVNFSLWMAFTASTTFGSGTYTIGVPWVFSTSGSSQQITGIVSVTGGRYPLVAQPAGDGTGNMSLYAPTSATNTAIAVIGSSAIPGGGTWGSGSVIRLTGSAEIQ